MASPPVNATLVIPQGTTWIRRWRISDPDTGEPRDLTNWTARGSIRATVDAATVLYAFPNIAPDPSGYITITVLPAESSTWVWRYGVYDIELVDPLGRVARVSQGAVRVSPEVTR
jgi:hypothetical protein